MAKREASENAAAAEALAAPAVQESEFQLLDQIVNEGRLARDETMRERGRGLVSEFVKQILEGQMTVAPDTEAMIHARIAQIDHLLSLQLNEVLHHPKFQKLEAMLGWRQALLPGPEGRPHHPFAGQPRHGAGLLNECSKHRSWERLDRKPHRVPD